MRFFQQSFSPGRVDNFQCSVLLFLFFLLFMTPGWVIGSQVTQLQIKGAIGPATADYLIRGISAAQSSDLVLIQMDTPGGLNKSTRSIIQAILNSATPIVTYVAPSGARAASAGTFILYAATLAAMAPGTHLGAASPVSLGDMGGTPKSQNGKKPSVKNQKAKNDAIAYIRALVQFRGRDAQFAVKAVSEASTMTADEALKAGVINYLAKNRADLLTQINAKVVRQNNKNVRIQTNDAHITHIKPDWRTRILLVLTDPTLAYLLLLLGIYGIFFELVNPGFIAPGVIGAIAMLVALYALHLLPINYAGLGLMILGLAFLVAEVFLPSFGVLGIGGTLAFVIGSLLLIDTSYAMYQIAWPAIAAMVVVNVVFILGMATLVFKTRRKPLMHGDPSLIGATGVTIEKIDLQGQAMIRGEIWQVQAEELIEARQPIVVISAKDLLLTVKRQG